MRVLFDIKSPVARPEYLLAGVLLGLVKFSVEAGTVWATCGRWPSFWELTSPLLGVRQQLFVGGPEWLLPAQFVWSLPFVYFAVTLSVRRAISAGWDSTVALVLSIVPYVNWVLYFSLCFAPPGRTPSELFDGGDDDPAAEKSVFLPDLGVIVGGALLALLTVWAVTYLLEDFGAGLFFGLPLEVAAVEARMLYEIRRRGVAAISVRILGSFLLAACLVVLFAAEGMICVAMLAVPVALLVGVGTLIGVGIAKLVRLKRSEQTPAVVLCVMLPLVLTWEEAADGIAPVRPVRTEVVVDAPPEAVWPYVVEFPELDEPVSGLFTLGFAAPIGATIEGEGVGAVRHCRFTTGAFVEPITVWEPPRRLAFDVAEQPAAMREMHPFFEVRPPHLHSGLVFHRGEFRLEDLGDGRTRLVGTTWYRIELRPAGYWSLWSDAIIHVIHRRVLRHVKRHSEARLSAVRCQLPQG
ncbi:MAG: SRPBCC family protein [Planctomycetota bacterium]